MRGLVLTARRGYACRLDLWVHTAKSLLDSIGRSPFLIYTPPNALPNLEIVPQTHQLMGWDCLSVSPSLAPPLSAAGPSILAADSLTYCLMSRQARA